MEPQDEHDPNIALLLRPFQVAVQDDLLVADNKYSQHPLVWVQCKS